MMVILKQGANTNVLGSLQLERRRARRELLQRAGVCVPFPSVDLDLHGHWGHHNLF